MKRYFFDLDGTRGALRDEHGETCTDLDEVRAQVQGILTAQISHELPDGDQHEISCDVRDASGTRVYTGRITYEGRVHRSS